MDNLEKIGIVIIGRNEDKRLQLCFDSMNGLECAKVYVDSCSTDSSIAIAESNQIEIIELDLAKPLSAARARNEGFQRLVQLNPSIEFVQFIDGDCTLLAGWIEVASNALINNSQRAAVIGHLLERNIEASSYNRLCALEWRSAPGDLSDFGALGGISMIRTSVFKELGGFNPEVIAGEDSEFGVRMGLAGYKVTKLDQQMATHDANILKFSQWWKRSVRAGHAIGQRAFINGDSAHRDCMKERNSTLFWGGLIPLLIVVLLPFTQGYSLLLVGAYFYLGYRVITFRLKLGDSLSDAWFYTKFLLLSKFANMVGLMKFNFNKLSERYEIIEYK
ncbi:MAG: glycosyltransferase family 2 protein [Methylophaga sp.]|nr:glycosyltransferase family 2 protein [Methylophaga sp.]